MPLAATMNPQSLSTTVLATVALKTLPCSSTSLLRRPLVSAYPATSDLTFKPIGAAPDAELLSFGETTGTTKIGDDSVPTVGVTGGGAAAPLKALWRAGTPDAQPLTELCIFENLIEGEEATVARFVTTEAGFTTATAHSKIEADEPDTKVCDSLPPSGLLAGPLLSTLAPLSPGVASRGRA